MDKYFNPFLNTEIRYPKTIQEKLKKYTQTKTESGEPNDPIKSPFERMIDLWYLSLCFGILKNNKIPLDSNNSVKMVEGTIFSSDPWRSRFLLLLFIGLFENADIIHEPRKIIELANEYAAGGYQIVFKFLEDGNMEPIDNIFDNILNIKNSNSIDIQFL